MSTLGMLRMPFVGLRATANVFFISRLLCLPSTPLYGHISGARALGSGFVVVGVELWLLGQDSHKRPLSPKEFPRLLGKTDSPLCVCGKISDSLRVVFSETRVNTG